VKSSKTSGHLALLVANVIFGVNNPIARMLMPEHIEPLALTFFRFAGGMVLFWLASIVVKDKKVTAKDKWLLLGASFFALTINQIPFFYGLSLTSPIDASIVVTMLPIVTMILAAFILKEPVTRMKVVGVLVGASGALLIVLGSAQHHEGPGSMAGNMIVFIAVTSFGIYLTVFKQLISRYHPVTVMKWMFLWATITGLPLCYSSLTTVNLAVFTPSTWLSIGFVVVFATFFGYLLLPVGQKVLRPTTLAMYNYVQPVMASLVAVLVGIDNFGYQQGLAALLVFAGVYVVTQSKSREQLEAERQLKN
jgi:drug/metabolite transporter (DMT)-like permease